MNVLRFAHRESRACLRTHRSHHDPEWRTTNKQPGPLVTMAPNLLAMVSTLVAMASTLVVMASTPLISGY